MTDKSEAWYGRSPSLDDRDQQHLIKQVPIPRAVTEKYWTPGPVLDQGPTPQCVGYAGTQFLYTGPVRNKGNLLAPSALYLEAQKNDEWDGEDYEGTSVRGLFKALQQAGYVTAYEWAFQLEPAVAYVLTTGPLVLGTNWYAGMDEPDRYGFLSASGELMGGHCYLAIGVNRKKACPDKSKGAFRIVNSWGKDWGQVGRAWLSFKDAGRLIADEWGEACTATEILKK